MIEQRKDYALIYDLLEQGTRRMNAMETDLNAMTKIANSMQGFLRALQIAGAIAGALAAMFCWVLLEKNSDIKNNQAAITALLISNSKIMGVLENVVETNKSQQTRIESNTDILLRRGK